MEVNENNVKSDDKEAIYSRIQIYEKDNVLVAIFLSEDGVTGDVVSTARLIPPHITENITVNVDDEEAAFLKEYLDIDMEEYRTLELSVEAANDLIRDCFRIESAEVASVADDDGSTTNIGMIATRLLDKIHGPYSE
jgi:hypothetical protein